MDRSILHKVPTSGGHISCRWNNPLVNNSFRHQVHWALIVLCTCIYCRISPMAILDKYVGIAITTVILWLLLLLLIQGRRRQLGRNGCGQCLVPHWQSCVMCVSLWWEIQVNHEKMLCPQELLYCDSLGGFNANGKDTRKEKPGTTPSYNKAKPFTTLTAGWNTDWWHCLTLKWSLNSQSW